MDYRDRATSLMKKKEEINMNSLKNRNTVKPRPPSLSTKLLENNDENSKNEEKKTLLKDPKANEISMKFEENDENSIYQDPSPMNSHKSMPSALSINERKHLDFNIKKMIELIESCCTNPLKQVECIVELFKGVDFILNHENLWPEIFKCDNDDRSSQIRLVIIVNLLPNPQI